MIPRCPNPSAHADLRRRPRRPVNSDIRRQMPISLLLLLACPSIAFAFGDWPAAVGKLTSGKSVVFQRLSSDESGNTKIGQHIKAQVSVCHSGKLLKTHIVECEFPSTEQAFVIGSSFSCVGLKKQPISGATYTLEKYVSPEHFKTESAIFQATYRCSSGCSSSPSRIVEGQDVKEVPCAL